MPNEELPAHDHRRLGVELDLFLFSDLVGSGLPLWTPKGTALRMAADNFVWELRQKYGYERVEIPHLAKKELYEKSGHWAKFKDELFLITTREGHQFAMKPMNCPHHIQIYDRTPHSYRELPIRYANTTMVYRDEQTGELNGLSRVRSLTQDDAHIFCRLPQAEQEVINVWKIISEFYNAVGFTKFDIRLSFHDPKKMNEYLGTPELWQQAEDILRQVTKIQNAVGVEAPGEAAFYGPKIDFMAKDSLGRNWQIATIQMDLNLPGRFDLNCINETGQKERIVMVHAAIMGSIERYLALIIEHLKGAFPLWLAPVQVLILPISDSHNDYTMRIFDELKQIGIRTEINLDSETLGKKIRAGKTQKIPYLVVIGDKEVSSNTLTAEGRTEKLDGISLADFITRLQTEIKEKK
ncbi:MAG: threonine--tRNA ligase [Candidatus Vogelbacteria bacterium]